MCGCMLEDVGCIGVCSGGFGVMSAQAYTLIVFHVNASAKFFTTI